MNTPPTLPPEFPNLLPPKRKRSALAKLATIFAVVLVVTFGLCSVTFVNSSNPMSGPVFPVSLVIVAICAIGLLICAVVVIINSLRRRKV